MKSKKTWTRWIVPAAAVVVGAIVAAIAADIWFSAGVGTAADATGRQHHGPVASVQVAPIRRDVLAEAVPAYGVIVAPPGNVRALSVDFEARVLQVLVGPGEHVSAGAALARIEPSAATRLQLEEAKNAEAAAKETLAQVEEQYKNNLATNQQLRAARNDLATAEAKLSALHQTGLATTRQLTARHDGIVSAIGARPGQLIAPGTPILEIADAGKISLKLEVEPEDLPDLRIGQQVDIQPIYADQSASTKGHVRMIGRAVNAQTRLVDVFVSLPPDSNFLLGQYMKGTFYRTAEAGWTIPRRAVLPSGDGYILFTVENGHAVQRKVRLTFETDDMARIEGEGLKAGLPAVVVGNYELDNGMAVKEVPATSTGHSNAGTTPTADAQSGGSSP